VADGFAATAEGHALEHIPNACESLPETGLAMDSAAAAYFGLVS
jgi:hypothetical protein